MLNTFYLLLCCVVLSCIAFRCDNPVRKRGEVGTLKKWPDNTIPYEIDSVYSSADVDLIKSSLADLSTKSGNCVKFVPRTSQHVVWVRVVSLDGCYSDLGLAVETGLQQLSLDRSGCMTIDTIQHEFLHALGFPHEQTRLERDTYVKVLYENIQPKLSTKSDNCVKFVPRTSEHVAWIRVVSLDGCWSKVGLAVESGVQQLSLDRSGCLTADTIQHEFIHALGFPHEQKRLDRDAYVKILYENVEPNKKHNFDKDPQGSILSFGLPYDFNSIMHYTSDSFSTNGLPVMVPASQNDKSWRYTMGAGNKLTETDLYKIKKVYGCIA
ncbi:unnamed protein product [Adineta steineri]|uniref:Metalloendopeptidase n=1 Tax=Adineta steineri TaxID=433720 RepID=A0A814UKF9_9BILA|nr:unnamed protein product [Adineta steineri]